MMDGKIKTLSDLLSVEDKSNDNPVMGSREFRITRNGFTTEGNPRIMIQAVDHDSERLYFIVRGNDLMPYPESKEDRYPRLINEFKKLIVREEDGLDLTPLDRELLKLAREQFPATIISTHL
jgi:hypothetical protein